MSQQNKRTPAKGTDAKSKRTRAKKRTKKGPKVYIPASKMIVLCAVVVIACSALLFVTTALDQKRKREPQKIAEIEKAKQNAKKKSGVKKESANANAERTQSSSKDAPQKTASKADAATVASEPLSKRTSTAPSESVSPAQTKPAKKNGTLKNKDASIGNKENTSLKERETEKTLPRESAPAQSAQQLQKKKNEVALKPVEKNPPPQKNALPQAADIPEIPVARPGAKLIVIFDDGGQNVWQLEKCLALPFPVTVAVLPKLSHSKAAADKTRASGNDVMLHQPMQAITRPDGTVPNPGEGAIKPEMSLYEIESIVKENIAEIGPVVGLNNHEGSAICEDESRIGAVLNAANDNGIFFLDSRTTSQTRVPQAAMSMGYSYYERNVFLDNTKNRADIIAEIMRGVSIANKTGAAIMIGHVWSADILPPILAELYPLLCAKGYEFTTVPKSGALITP